MVARIHDKKLIVLCDCLDCRENRPTWRQGFISESGVIVIDLCENHHFILRTKVPNRIPLDENVLKWLLIQDANPHKVVKYGMARGTADIKMMKELKKIKIECE